MKRTTALWLSMLALAALGAAPAPRAYVGVVTDTMCRLNHAQMNVDPQDKCVLDCVRYGRNVKFALAVGTNVYTLSDQQTPSRFAAKKVKVTGTLYAKTNVLKVDRIEAVR
ncbi:MAG: hypothetical protein ACM3SQ_19915 [Betaproteobacteria bacterium]